MKDFIKKIRIKYLKSITYKEIGSHKVGHKSHPIEGMELERLPDNMEGTQFFWVRMKKGCEIPLNASDCNKDLVLFTGKILNTHREEYLTQNKITRIPAGEPMGFLAEEDSVWFAQHYKPQ